MQTTISHLKKGEKALIREFDVEAIPLKLLEMGCLPGNKIQLVQVAPFGDPLYYIVNDAHVAFRKETANEIFILKDSNS